MPFADFHGNADIVRTLREMQLRDHLPHALILSGPQGAGKFTLAQMVAKAMNCLERPTTDGLPDFCGRCTNCTRIAEGDALEERFGEAIEARENLREADKRETRIFVQTHPDVLIIPPDPPQMLVKVDQVRRVARGWFVQTPAYSFPIEPHALLPFAHWLPPRLRRPYWRLGVAGDWEDIALLRRQEMAELFGEPVAERVGPLVKSWISGPISAWALTPGTLQLAVLDYPCLCAIPGVSATVTIVA